MLPVSRAQLSYPGTTNVAAAELVRTALPELFRLFRRVDIQGTFMRYIAGICVLCCSSAALWNRFREILW